MYNACWLAYTRFRLFPVRSPLLGESRLISVPEGTEMFQFPTFASGGYVFTDGFRDMTPGGFPHSDILGSKPVWRLPEAFRSLPRPSSPLVAKASTMCPYVLVPSKIGEIDVPSAIFNCQRALLRSYDRCAVSDRASIRTSPPARSDPLENTGIEPATSAVQGRRSAN
jgi:hypothetical protein